MGKYDMAYEQPISKGEHVFAVLKAEERPSDKVTGTTNIFVQLAVAEGEYEGRQIVKTFSTFKNNGEPNTMGRGLIRSFFVAMGLVKEDEQGEVEVTQEQLDGLTGMFVIAKGKITDFAGPPQWEPVSFKMHESMKGAVETTAAAEAAPEQPAPAPTPTPAKTTTAAKPAAGAAGAAKTATAAKPAGPRRQI
jgi:hypothetical protein